MHLRSIRWRFPFWWLLSNIRPCSNYDGNAGDDAQSKRNLYFSDEIRNCLNLSGTPKALKRWSGLICNDSVQFRMNTKISRRLWRSSDYAELGHFTFKQRTGFITHVHSYWLCSLNLLFMYVYVSLTFFSKTLDPLWSFGYQKWQQASY